MTCSRCHALMIHESSLHHRNEDYAADLSDVRLLQHQSMHCLLCGNYEDAVILRNRAIQVQEQRQIQDAAIIATWAESLSIQAA